MELNTVIEKAEEIAQLYNPESLSPFPYERIEKDKEDLKINLIELPGELSGAITFDKVDQKFGVFINKTKPKTRQNFTIAHELGHYFLHQDIIKSEEIIADGEPNLDGNKTLFRLDNYTSNNIETEANNFAANLIMPRELVIKAWEELNDVEECAKVFSVSVSAMSIRLEKLGLLTYDH